MNSITCPFKAKTRLLNDHVMNNLITKRFELRGKVTDRPFLREQMCREMAQNLAEWRLQGAEKKRIHTGVKRGKNGRA